MIPDSKICAICGVDKPKDEYQIRRKPNGYCWLRRECKKCQNNLRKIRYKTIEEVRIKILDRGKKYAALNREERLRYYREYEIKNKEKKREGYKRKYARRRDEIKKQRKEYYKKNRQHHISVVEKYRKNNWTSILTAKRINHQKRKATDLHYKIMKRLRSRVTNAVKLYGGGKHEKTRLLIGCTIPFLIKHLESKFLDGMNWDNYGFRGWHVDHKIPCSAFNLANEDEQKKCFHYTNLQPLWWRDNISKSNKMLYEAGV